MRTEQKVTKARDFVSEKKIARFVEELKGAPLNGQRAGETGVSARAILGINEVTHCVAGNLRYRVGANVWSLQDCIEDYEEVARHYGLSSIFQSARAITDQSFLGYAKSAASG